MSYKLINNNDGIIFTDNDGTIWYVPNEPLNRHWQEYQAWMAEDPENNIPEPADEE